MTHAALRVARHAAACVAGAALAGCAGSPPLIGGVPAAPPRPEAFWTPPGEKPASVAQRSALDSARAAPAAIRQLSLSAVVDLALRNNPATRISWSEARAAADILGASRGDLYPFLSASASATRSRSATTPGGVERTQYGPSVSLSYLVLDFGGRSGSIESARQAAIAASFSHNVTVQNTVLAAESATFGFIATRALRDAQRAAVEEAAASLGAAEERHRVGLATIADVLQARTARAQEQLNLETLEGQVQVTRGNLAVAMGLSPTAEFDLLDVVAPDSSSVRSVAQSVDSIIAVATASRPDLAAAHAEAARASAQLRVTQSAGRPAINFIASGGYVGSEISNLTGRTYSLNLGISIPLFTGFSNEYAVRAASEQVNAARARAEATSQQVALEVFSAYYALQTATERVRTSTELLASAQASDSVALGRYTEGVGSIVDVLIAQSTLASARAQAVGARWQWRTALAVLAHDAGILDARGTSAAPFGAPPGNDR